MAIDAWRQIERLPQPVRESVNRELTVANRKRPFIRMAYGEFSNTAAFLREFSDTFTTVQLDSVLSRYTEAEKDVLFAMLNGKDGEELRTRVLSANQRTRRAVASAIKRAGGSVDGNF